MTQHCLCRLGCQLGPWPSTGPVQAYVGPGGLYAASCTPISRDLAGPLQSHKITLTQHVRMGASVLSAGSMAINSCQNGASGAFV